LRPWANGIVERVNRFIKSSLTKLSNSPQEWKENLHTMQYIVNNTYHAVTKSSPSKLMFGYEQRNHADFALAQFTKILADIDINIERERGKARDLANTATKLIRAYNKEYRD